MGGGQDRTRKRDALLNTIETAIPGVLIIEPPVFRDGRGFVYESFNRRMLAQSGIEADFVQENHSSSAHNVLRGLHYQIRHAQGKLVRATAGEVFDVTVDLRRRSPTFGRHVALRLSATNRLMVWIPPGFAHGFLALSEHAELNYKLTDYWHPEFERTIAWNDPTLAIAWPLVQEPQLSAKDSAGALLDAAEVFD